MDARELTFDTHHRLPRREQRDSSTDRRNALALANRGLVFFVLRRYFPRLTGEAREDAVSAGYVGLLRAAEKWKPEQGAFSTFAVRSIVWRIRREVKTAYQRGFVGSREEVIPPGFVVSMGAPTKRSSGGGEVSASTIADLLADPDSESGFDALLDRDERADRLAGVWQQIERLTPRHADILRLTYRDGLTNEEIARRRGETVKAIQNGHRNALARLRECLARQEARAAAGGRI